MNVSRRRTLGALSLTLGIAAPLAAAPTSAAAYDQEGDGWRPGTVYTSSNAIDGNQLLVYRRGPGRTLTLKAQVPTGGLGSGAGLGSQGAVTLSSDGCYLYVVNAQSSTLSTFHLHGAEPRLVSAVASGGQHPISVTEHEGVVYVLNDAGLGNVAGFRNVHGQLQPIAGSTGGLSVAGGAGPAQVGFSDDGDAIVITEKNTNTLTSYRVNANGSLGPRYLNPSPGQTPFGFAFNRRNRLIVTEAAGGAPGASTVSSYRFSEADPAQPRVVSAAVPDTQGAACWVSIVPSGRFAFISNTGSSSVSSYRIVDGGGLALVKAVAGETGTGSAPADSAISADGRHLYVRNGRSFTISVFDIGGDGSLAAESTTAGLPATAVGLAAD